MDDKPTKKTPSYKQFLFDDKGDRITGNMLVAFRTEHNFSISKMVEIFCCSFNLMHHYLTLEDKGIDNRVICYLYRLYRSYPTLLEESTSIKEFFSAIGGVSTVKKSDFSLMIGLEQSAYTRIIDGDENASSSIILLIDLIKKITNNNFDNAFKLLSELSTKEGFSRGFDVLETRTWTPDPTKRGKPRRTKKENNDS